MIGTLLSQENGDDLGEHEGELGEKAAPKITVSNIREYSAQIQDLPLQVVWCEESYICDLLNAGCDLPEAPGLYTATQVPRSRRHPEVAQKVNDFHLQYAEHYGKFCPHDQCGNPENPLPSGSVCLCQCIAQGLTLNLGQEPGTGGEAGVEWYKEAQHIKLCLNHVLRLHVPDIPEWNYFQVIGGGGLCDVGFCAVGSWADVQRGLDKMPQESLCVFISNLDITTSMPTWDWIDRHRLPVVERAARGPAGDVAADEEDLEKAFRVEVPVLERMPLPGGWSDVDVSLTFPAESDPDKMSLFQRRVVKGLKEYKDHYWWTNPMSGKRHWIEYSDSDEVEERERTKGEGEEEMSMESRAKMHRCLTIKAKGNDRYKEGKFEAALELYREALVAFLHPQSAAEKTRAGKDTGCLLAFQNVVSNYAQASLKLQRFEEVVTAATQIVGVHL
eukprot:gene17344-20639_t